MALAVLERPLQTLQGSGGATGSLRRRRARGGQPAAQRARAGYGGPARGQRQAQAGWRGAGAAGRGQRQAPAKPLTAMGE
jgi:hypothetical protein